MPLRTNILYPSCLLTNFMALPQMDDPVRYYGENAYFIIRRYEKNDPFLGLANRNAPNERTCGCFYHGLVARPRTRMDSYFGNEALRMVGPRRANHQTWHGSALRGVYVLRHLIMQFKSYRPPFQAELLLQRNKEAGEHLPKLTDLRLLSQVCT